MDLRRLIIYGAFYIPYGIHKITRTGAFGPDGMVPLYGPIPSDGNPLKAALIKHQVKQFHEASCSVATVVSVINAIRDSQGETVAPITQMDILEKVRTANWKERMSAGGDNGKRGLPLSVLEAITRSSLDAYGIRYDTLEAVQARKEPDQAKIIKEVLWQRLDDFEKKGNCLIIAHFDQGAYVPDLNIPHISPVGSFDREKGMVTVLDVDPFQENPYQVRFDTFYRGLSSNYLNVLKPFGFNSGGYIYIKLSAS
ncbi:MAG: phytochelatin synthase family protein [Desulfobacterales bacterium]